MEKLSPEQAANVITKLINEATVKGSLVIASAQALNFLTEEAKKAEILDKRVKDLELEIKGLKK